MEIELALSNVIGQERLVGGVATGAATGYILSSRFADRSGRDGHLSIRWHLKHAPDASRLKIAWIESGVVMPASAGAGYGRELIERALPYQLDAETSYTFGPDGVHCTIELPVSTTMELEETHG